MLRILIFVFLNVALVNIGFFLSFLIRYGLPFPERNFAAYESSFFFLTVIYLICLAGVGVYKIRFPSSWDFFKRVVAGIFLATLFSVAFMYAFRTKLGAFPSSIFVMSFFLNLVLIFKVNQFVLKKNKRIKKHTVILGSGSVNEIVGKKAEVERVEKIGELTKFRDIDEIIISNELGTEDNLNLLLFIAQKFKARVYFNPAIYISLLNERINGKNSVDYLKTFIGKLTELDEFLIRLLDITGSLLLLVIFAPLMFLITLLIKVTSPGPVLYQQERVGKDGKSFTLLKFRTMVKDAEKEAGPVLADKKDPRITKVGGFLRPFRLDEFPQLFNVLKGDMSLVGPRPERAHFVKKHKALREVRLTVKPGLTGLAQIRNLYDLEPKHKIKYDYLYIQRRSLALNLLILLRTVPVIFSKKGW